MEHRQTEPENKPKSEPTRFIPLIKPSDKHPIKPPKTKFQEIDDLVKAALADDTSVKDVDLGVVTDYQAATIRANTGLTTNGFTKKISAIAISHSLKKHGVGNEVKETQVGVTNDDFREVSDILVAPNSIQSGGKNSQKQDVILFIKVIKGHTYYVAMSVREKRRELSFSTMYIKR